MTSRSIPRCSDCTAMTFRGYRAGKPTSMARIVVNLHLLFSSSQEYGLYYDGNNGCYYSYDHAKDSYEFHSQAQVQVSGCSCGFQCHTTTLTTVLLLLAAQPLSDCAYSSLLAGFHKLRIDRMRSNALGKRQGPECAIKTRISFLNLVAGERCGQTGIGGRGFGGAVR